MFLTFRSARRACLLAVLGSGAACTASNASLNGDDAPVGLPGVNASLSFVDKGPLLLTPGELTEATAVGSPAAPYAFSFHLVGAALDASLSAKDVVADDDGAATVSLRAPNQATTFAVRATIKDGPSAELQVAVSDQGFGRLEIVPMYAGGREVREWVASAASGKTCAGLAASFPADPEGALTVTVDPEQPILIEGAPVGPALAVFVRAGHYMWGCRDTSSLGAGTTSVVEVPIVNKPIDASAALLDIALAFAPEPEPWQAILDAHLALMVGALTAQKPSDAEALLWGMQNVSNDPSAFDEASQQNGWLDALAQQLQQKSADLGGALESLAEAGLAAQPPEILGHVAAMTEAPGNAVFTLASIGSVEAAASGVPDEYLMSLSVDPGDRVHLGGALFFLPSRYLGASIDAAALSAGAFGVVDALASAVGCDELALTGLEGCDPTCMAQLCRKGLELLWSKALDVSASTYSFAEIPMQASGTATFDDVAALTGFDGTWLGQVVLGGLSAKVTGAVTAKAPDEPPPAE